MNFAQTERDKLTEFSGTDLEFRTLCKEFIIDEVRGGGDGAGVGSRIAALGSKADCVSGATAKVIILLEELFAIKNAQAPFVLSAVGGIVTARDYFKKADNRAGIRACDEFFGKC
jgi:hypothetical protein